VFLSLGNRKNLLGLSLENGVVGAQRVSDVLPDNWMISDVIAGALSWCSVKVWFSHISGLSLRTASLKHYNFLIQLFMYHLTRWYKFMMDSAFLIKKYNKHHLDV
jgi:hypothetical protein